MRTLVTGGTGFTVEDRVSGSAVKLATEDRRQATAGPVTASAAKIGRALSAGGTIMSQVASKSARKAAKSG